MESTNIIKYNWVAFEVARNTSILSIKMLIDTNNIVVNDPSDWLVLPMDLEKSICNSFDRCSVPFYEYLFTRI